MKQKDIALIIVIAGFSTLVAFVLASFIISSPKNRQTQVEVVEKIGNSFPEVDKRYINTDSINPTQTVQIGDSDNSRPFN